jgi:hypothetical protein
LPRGPCQRQDVSVVHAPFQAGLAPQAAGQTRDLLYSWPTLAAAFQIFLVNGEKAADRSAQQLGLCTTCHVEGEGEWHTAFNEIFRGKSVVVVLDNDDKGEQHGAVVAR